MSARFETEMEKKLWGWLFRSQTALAVMLLEERNRTREEENDWPAGQEWGDLAGSSQAIFARGARAKAGIPDEDYLDTLRNNYEALDIADGILEEFDTATVALPSRPQAASD